MKTITIQAYTFDELSDSAKQKARDWFREASAGDDWWSESAIDEAVEQGQLLGIDFDLQPRKNMKGEPLPGKPKIWWSGFYSQGDGACFEGTWRASQVKADKVADGWGEDPATTEIKRIASEFERIARAYPESSFHVTHRDCYCHEHSVDFDFQFPDDNEGEDWPEDKRKEYDKTCDDLKEAARDFMRWIYRQLEKEYGYRNSDECVDEDIRANEYLFTEEGKRSTVL
jgi:hypothetical protein